MGLKEQEITLEKFLSELEIDLYTDETFVICGLSKGYDYTDKTTGQKKRKAGCDDILNLQIPEEEKKCKLYDHYKKNIRKKGVYYTFYDAIEEVIKGNVKRIGIWIPENYVVIDTDTAEDNYKMQQYLSNNNITTAVCKTKKGGHYWFKYEGDEVPNDAGILTKAGFKVDYRVANKGYIILPFNDPDKSVLKIEEASYLPADLLPDIKKAKKKTELESNTKELKDWETSRNQKLLHELQRRLSKNITAPENLLEEAKVLNKVYCSNTSKGELEEDEVVKAVESAIQYINNGSFKINEAKETKPLEKKKSIFESCIEIWDQNEEEEKGIEFLIDGLVYEGCLGMIVGSAKSNKTTLTYNLARAVADENINSFLGHAVLKHTRVLYILGEGTMTKMQQNFGKCKNFTKLETDEFQIETDYEELKNMIIKGKYGLVILDSLYTITDLNISDPVATRKFLKKYVVKLKKETGATVIVNTHMGRNTHREQQLTLDSIQGSYEITKAVEFAILINAIPFSDEEKMYRSTLSNEDLNKLPRKRRIKKELFRYGGEGFDSYDLDINFELGIIDYERTSFSSLGSTSPTEESAVEYLARYCKQLFKDDPFFEIFNLSKLSEELGKLQSRYSSRTIQNKYAEKVCDYLISIDKVEKNGRSYRVIQR